VDRVRSADQRRVVYLDHAASSPLRPEVRAAMAPFVEGRFGNPSGSHAIARQARRTIEEAREVVAVAIGAQPGEVVFTSGGTEGANLAVLGTLAARRGAGLPVGAVVCSAVEHAAVLESCRAVAGSTMGIGTGGTSSAEPLGLRIAPVDADGAVDLDAFEALLDDEVGLVSVMLANNEVGTIQPVDRVVEAVRRRVPDAAVHTDAVQAACFLDLTRLAAGADLVSISAHKLGGPQGVGALVVRDRVAVSPIIHGGGQERERRSGTHNVAGVVGLAAALQAAVSAREVDAARVRALRDELAKTIEADVPGTVRSVDLDRALPGHCHLRFEGVEQEELLLLLDERGVCASGGAACASGALEPSHVLAAMGVDATSARGAIRFTLGYTTTAEDVAAAVAAVGHAVTTLRGDRGWRAG
jgi:cysteine desulfurase